MEPEGLSEREVVRSGLQEGLSVEASVPLGQVTWLSAHVVSTEMWLFLLLDLQGTRSWVQISEYLLISYMYSDIISIYCTYY